MSSTWSSGTILRTSMHGEETAGFSNDTSFTFRDFLPEIRKRGGFFTSATYETFRTLIDRANEWLRSNRKWEIVTCESIEFKAKGDEIDYTKMTYLEYGEAVTSYIRGLRLWLREKRNKDEREQQIGYLNLIPRQLEKGGIFSSPKFETLDSVIERFNSMLYSNPLPGRVITIESQEMKVSNFKDFDPDRSNWHESGSIMTHFLFVIRVFYEVMTGSSEEIGIKDFAPDMISRGGIFSLPEYEPFSNVVNKASDWCSQQQELRFCNAQSVEIKMKRGWVVNSKKMEYVESGNMTTFYVRILRVAYTKPQINQYFQSEKPSPIRKLTCKSFVPVQLTTGLFVPDYENLCQTKERVFSWIKATGAHVISAETSALRIMSGGERKHGTEASFTYNRSETSEYWIFVIRLYLDGIYREPPAEMLPPLPEIERSCCLIL